MEMFFPQRFAQPFAHFNRSLIRSKKIREKCQLLRVRNTEIHSF